VKLYKDGGHQDHIVPKCDGGTDHFENLALSCCFCNMAKAYHSLDDFMSWIEWLRSGESYSPLNTDLQAVMEKISISKPPFVGNRSSQVIGFKQKVLFDEKMLKVAGKTLELDGLINHYKKLILLIRGLSSVRRVEQEEKSEDISGRVARKNRRTLGPRPGLYTKIVVCGFCKKKFITGVGATLCRGCR